VETDRLTVKRWALLLFGAVLFFVYLTRVGWADVAAAGRVFPLGVALLVILLNSGTGILKLRRWQGLLRSRGISQPRSVGQEYLAVNAGYFLGLVTPGTAGELARGALSDVKNSRAVALVAFEKTTDLGILLLMVLASLVVQFTTGLESWAFIIALSLASILSYAIFTRFDRWLTGPIKWLLGKITSETRQDLARSIYWEYYELIANRRVLLRSCLYSTGLWVLPVLQMHMILQGLGSAPPLKTSAFLFLGPYLVGVASMIPSGVGAFDLTVNVLGARALEFAGSTVAAASVAPLYFRLLVTLPLISLGFASQVLLNIRKREIQA